MDNKTAKIIISSAVAASAFVAVAPSQQANAATNIEQLISDVQKAGTVLKWAISIEGTADGVTQPWNQFNAAKTSIDKVEAALNGVSYSDKLKYDAQLVEPKTQLQRAQAYLDAITASTKIEAKRTALSEAVVANNLEQVEAAYHQMSAEFRKQTILLDRVYGQSTRDKIRNVVKGPAEQLINYVKNDVTVHMFMKDAVEKNRVGKFDEADKKINEAQSILNSSVLIWGSTLKKSIEELVKSQPVQLVSTSRVDNTTVTAKLNKAVSTINLSEFTFDNSLTVTNASLSKDGTTVTLTTSVQTPGIKYTMKYKGSSASFTVPGSIAPIQIGNQTTQHRDTSEVLALTATFPTAYGQSSDRVRIEVPAGLKLLTINGVENVIPGAKSINVTPDKNGTVIITFTANSVNTPAVDKVFTFSKLVNNTVVETQTSGVFNFYTAAKAGSFTNKKVMYVDTIRNYFITSDGMQYNVKTSGDIYKNEGIAVSFDSFKSALNAEDTISGTYQPTSASTFDITFNFYFVDLLLDSKFAYKSGTAGYRMIGSSIELSGTAQPNYELLFYNGSGAYIGKTKVASNGVWKYTTSITRNAINDFSFIQQAVGLATPSYSGSNAKTFRIVEGQFELASVSAGTDKSEELENKEVTFTVAPVKSSNGLVLAQDQALVGSNATITVQDLDGTKVKFTNNQSNTIFSSVGNGFKIKFGTIDASKGTAVILANGTDGLLTGDLKVISIEGITNAYGLNMTLNNGFQITGY
ncbi:hypothetical protein [Psychrobacillus sp. L3]|uniref:hypothetical protein n=1 Tax=Psychrobacillus sp. L3 TaxID=3236891 RepID=UPI0036F1D5E6